MSNNSLWVLGEALIDCVAQPDGSLQTMLGGSPFNLACAAAMQGVDVGYLNPFSSDVFGLALAAKLAECGAQALHLPSLKPTSLAVVHIDHGHPSYGFYREGIADRDYNAEDIVSLLKKHPAGVLHTGSLMAMPPEHHKVLHVIQFAKALGWTISVDVNLRTKVAYDLPAYLDAVSKIAALADWLKASDEDMQLLGWSHVTWNNAAHLANQWSAMGCSRMALTFGNQGAWLQVGETHIHAPAKVIDFVDSVGAGDTFWATCLADWLQDADWRNSADAQTRVATTLNKALSAAAFNCAHTGCTPPSAEQLRQITRQ
jgi:fructokinase